MDNDVTTAAINTFAAVVVVATYTFVTAFTVAVVDVDVMSKMRNIRQRLKKNNKTIKHQRFYIILQALSSDSAFAAANAIL